MILKIVFTVFGVIILAPMFGVLCLAAIQWEPGLIITNASEMLPLIVFAPVILFPYTILSCFTQLALIQTIWNPSHFPYIIYFFNIISCLLLGLLIFFIGSDSGKLSMFSVSNLLASIFSGMFLGSYVLGVWTKNLFPWWQS
jgi:hypothetical protein